MVAKFEMLQLKNYWFGIYGRIIKLICIGYSYTVDEHGPNLTAVIISLAYTYFTRRQADGME